MALQSAPQNLPVEADTAREAASGASAPALANPLVWVDLEMTGERDTARAGLASSPTNTQYCKGAVHACEEHMWGAR